MFISIQDSLLHLVSKRIGVETFLSKLGEVSRHEYYSKASKQPHPRADSPSELLLDYEFCKLFKALEGKFYLFHENLLEIIGIMYSRIIDSQNK